MQAYPPSKIFTAAAAAKSLQSCPTLRDPMDCSLPGSSVHGIFQARVLEWGAIMNVLNNELERFFYSGMFSLFKFSK